MQAKPAAGAGKKVEEEEIDPRLYRQNRIAAMEKLEVSSASCNCILVPAELLAVRGC